MLLTKIKRFDLFTFIGLKDKSLVRVPADENDRFSICLWPSIYIYNGTQQGTVDIINPGVN